MPRNPLQRSLLLVVSFSALVPRSAFRSVRCLLPGIALGVVSAAAATAQVPENVVIVGTVEIGGPYLGTTGVFYVTLPSSKSKGGVRTPLAPLPAELTVTPPKYGGAFSVLRRPSDGTVFVGDGATPGRSCHLHILKVAGPIVTSSRKVVLGAAPNTTRQNRQVSGLALLPDGRVLVCAAGLRNGSTGLPPLAIVDDTQNPPTVTRIRFTARSRYPWSFALAVSPDGRTAYLSNSRPAFPTAFPTILYSVDITKTVRVPLRKLYTWQDRFVTHLTTDPEGILYATTMDPRGGGSPVPSIDRIGGNGISMISSTPVSTNTPVLGPLLVRDTGQFVFVSADFLNAVNPNSVLISDRKGKLSVLAGPPAAGWGMPVALDINNAFETYGSGTNGANSYAFVDWPNPGGSAKVGNAKFSLTIDSTPGVATRSIMALGLRADDRPLAGVRLLVDLGQPHVLFPMRTRKPAVLPLPIPNNPTLCGTVLYAQSAHADAGAALATSNGLSVYIR